MRKYIPADKLIAEIKGIIAAVKAKNHPDELGSIEQCLAAAEIEALNLALDCIKELQQEQPELPGIEEPGIPGKDFIPVEWVDACEMYGKWKIVKQEQPEMDLEKAAEQYSQNILAGGEDMFDAIADGFIAGAKWHEEQMKKNAVDGHCFVSPVDPSVLFVQTEHFENKKGFRHGETCKVIVLKSL